MTRRKALDIVLKYLENAPNSDENLCIAKKTLQEMRNGLPGKLWDDESIRSAVERFIRENGRPPKVKELDTVLYLPPHPCVQRMYGMTAGRWLYENYPQGEDALRNYRYAYKDEASYREVFVQEYNRIHPESCLEYNRKRTAGTPSWQYIAKVLSVQTWTELKRSCGEALTHRRKGESDFEVVSQITFVDRK